MLVDNIIKFEIALENSAGYNVLVWKIRNEWDIILKVDDIYYNF